jgi:chromosome segregation ATPase
MMRVLIGSLIALVGNSCLAFQLSGRNSLYQHTFHASLPDSLEAPGEDTEYIACLRGKLEILQGVVKDLGEQKAARKEKVVAVENEHAEIVSDLEKQRHRNTEAHLSSRIEELLGEISRAQKLEDAACTRVDSMTSQLKEKSRELTLIHEELDQKEGELEKTRDKILIYEKETLQMERRQKENEKLGAQKVLSLKTEHLNELNKSGARIERMDYIIHEQKAEVAVLRERLEEGEAKCNERVEIASAAVEAAEKRTKNVTEELNISESHRKRLQVQTKLQQLVLRGLLAQLKDTPSP